MRRHQRGRALHLIAEVDRAGASFRLLVRADQGQDSVPVGESGVQRLELGMQRLALTCTARRRLERGGQLGGDLLQFRRRSQVVGQHTGQLQEAFGDQIGSELDVQVAVPAAHDRTRQLPAAGGGQHARGRLDPDQRPEGAQQLTAEGVIGEHGGFAVDRGRSPVVAWQRAESTQPLPDPLGQLPGGLAGEGQSEHLLGCDQPVRHQIHDPGSHRLGLAGPGAGDHQQRRQRRLDHRDLLRRRRRLTEQFGQLDRAEPSPDPRRRHRVTCRPSGCTGQLLRTTQMSQ